MTEETFTVKTISGQDYQGTGIIRDSFEVGGIVATSPEGDDVWIPNENIESIHGTLGAYPWDHDDIKGFTPDEDSNLYLNDDDELMASDSDGEVHEVTSADEIEEYSEEEIENGVEETYRQAVLSESIAENYTISDLDDVLDEVDDEELLEEAIEVDERSGAVSSYEDRLEEL